MDDGQTLQVPEHDTAMEAAIARYTVEEEPARETTHDVCDRFESLNFDKIMSNLWIIKWAKGMYMKADTADDEEKESIKSIVPHEAVAIPTFCCIPAAPSIHPFAPCRRAKRTVSQSLC